LLLASGAAAEDVVRLATGDGYPPWVDDRRADGGLALKLIRQLERRSGLAFEIHFMPWNRGEVMAERGTVDGVFPYIRSADREARFSFSAPLFTVEEAYWAAPGSNLLTVLSISGLEGHSVCVPRGYAVPPLIMRASTTSMITLNQPQSMNDCLRALLMKSTEVVVANPQLIHAWRRNQPGETPVPQRLPIPALKQHHHILWGPSGEKFAARVDAALAEMDRLGVIRAIENEALD
jgi:polar amino acid transport system substrate-binding protein